MKKKFFIITTVSESLPFFKGQINVLKKSFDVELISSPGIYLDNMCTQHNVAGHKVEMKREISLLDDIKSLYNLFRLFLKSKPFIVHGNTPKAALLSMIASWICGVPKRIYYIHGLRYQGEVGRKRKILMFMERLSCFFATDIIAVSKGVQETLNIDRITDKKAILIWNGSVNGIDLNYFNSDIGDLHIVRNDYGIQEQDFVFGFVGRLVKDKGINELVTAFKKLEQISTNVKLLLVGGYEEVLDPLKEETLKEIKSNSNIIFAGKQKDVRPFLKAMDLFVFPSYREGLCLVLMEAGAMKVPAISSDISGCNEIIENGKNGFLIQSKNENALFEKMKFCLKKREELEDMAAVSRKIVENRFEQNKLWQKSLEVYKKIANI